MITNGLAQLRQTSNSISANLDAVNLGFLIDTNPNATSHGSTPQSSCTRSGQLTTVGILIFSLLAATTDRLHAQELDPRLANYDITGQIRFQNPPQAEERRGQLVRAIWKDGLPTTRPSVREQLASSDALAAINPILMSRVDLYTTNVSAMDFLSMTYVAYPQGTTSAPARLAIVHAGHMPEGPDHALEAGLQETIERLLEHRFIVAVMQMPLVSWNQDATGVLPNGTPFEIHQRSVAGHDELFQRLEPTLGGQCLAFFLEPVVQVTNEMLARHLDNSGVLMIGLSGGGWTTHFSAALDRRIVSSIPVAGALPLYARPFSRGSKGDAEQEYAPILGEEDSNNDGVLDRAAGVCSWLEIFALGAVGSSDKQPRRQTQVINFDDSCCFNGPVYLTYRDSLAKRVADIGTGEWQTFVDRTHRSHLISKATLDEVLMPMLNRMTPRP